MNTEIKQQWLAALRSGEYKQGRGKLASQDDNGELRYCCLGVLCDLAVKAGVTTSVKKVYQSSILLEFAPEPLWHGDEVFGESNYLPDSVRHWAGLYEENPYVLVDDERTYPAAMNDEGASFSQIADFIEQHF